MKKGKRLTTYLKQIEPSGEVRQELALIYILRMRMKNIEPSIESIVKRYMISEETAEELLRHKPSQVHSTDNIYPLAEPD